MNSASAFCWAIAPASVAGLIAPASVNGVATIGWPWIAISSRPSDIGPSRRSGEFVLMIVMRLGSRASRSRSIPRARQIISTASSTTPAPNPRHCHVLSSSVMNAWYMSRWRVGDRQVGRLERAAALLVDDVERADDAEVVEEVGVVAGPPAALDVRDERRPADGAEHDVAVAEPDVPLRVAGMEHERRRRERDELLDLGRDRGGRCGARGRRGRRSARAGRGPGRRGPPSRSRRGSGATPGGGSRPRRRTGSRSGRYGLRTVRHGSCAMPPAVRRTRRCPVSASSRHDTPWRSPPRLVFL